MYSAGGNISDHYKNKHILLPWTQYNEIVLLALIISGNFAISGNSLGIKGAYDSNKVKKKLC